MLPSKTYVIASSKPTQRLVEAVGLAIKDIDLDHEYPHPILQQHPWRP